MTLELLQGSVAITRAAIAADCRFFAGYPMSPFTPLLESMSRELADAGGVCVNAESEIEGANMALGASAAGFRAATGSCGQGIALMQETIAEAALNETPLVVFNMARNQQDYYQCTRGGGWGDYRTLTLAPKDVTEAVEHTQLLFHLADKYRAPVILYGDDLLSKTQVGVEVDTLDLPALPAKDWALDGTASGTGGSRQIWTFAMGKKNDPGPGPEGQWRRVAAKFAAIEQVEARHEAIRLDDAETVVVAFGSAAKFVEYVVEELREQGHRIGLFRPITLWPFPGQALREATHGVRRVLVFELNAGQMIDDVRQYADDRDVIEFIGGVSIDESGLAFGPLLDAPVIAERILSAHLAEPASAARS